MTESSALIAVGGFPGAGKTALACRLARDLAVPRLCSDTTGGSVWRGLPDLPPGKAFRAGYEVLFALAEAFLRDGCSVIVDMSLGWDFQWERLDQLRAALPGTAFVPLLLRAPYRTCVERIGRRCGPGEAGRREAERFLAQPQLPGVWEYLARLDRPDLRVVDADRDLEQVYRGAVRELPGPVLTRIGTP